ncbi:MAG: hypothetical protein LBU34_01725 [Planctomycetaceae bacterium]|nr:hypothetical protein [Planctomycetaceae bacterium]
MPTRGRQPLGESPSPKRPYIYEGRLTPQRNPSAKDCLPFNYMIFANIPPKYHIYCFSSALCP